MCMNGTYEYQQIKNKKEQLSEKETCCAAGDSKQISIDTATNNNERASN